MSKLADLKAKGEPVTLSNGLVLEIRPMKLSVEAEIGEMITKEKITQAMSLLVKTSIKDSFPEATEEEIDSLNKKDLKSITEMVMKINNLNQEEKKSKPSSV